MPQNQDIYEEGYRPLLERGEIAPQSLGDVFEANRTIARADNSNYLDLIYDEELRPVLEAVNDVRRAQGLTTILPPSMGYLPGGTLADLQQVTSAQAARAGMTRGDRRAAGQAILDEVARIQRSDPQFLAGTALQLDEYLAPRLEREQATRAEAFGVAAGARGVIGTAVGFGGGMIAALEDPVVQATLPFGGAGRSAAMRILTEGGVQSFLELTLQGNVRENRAALGEQLTGGEMAVNVGSAFVLGSLFQGAFEGGRLAYDRLTPRELRLARALEQDVSMAQIDREALLREALQAFDPEEQAQLILATGRELTPQESGALLQWQRQVEIDAANPFAPIGEGRAQFEDRLTAALDTLLHGVPDDVPAPLRAAPGPAPRVDPPAAPARPAVAGAAGPFDMASYLARNRTAESGGNDTAAAESSSAYGRYQFLTDTWIEFYRRTFGDTGESRAQILRKRADGAVQDRVMATFTQANLQSIEGAGFAATQGNAYLAHFLGAGDALRVLRADPDAPIGEVVTAASIRANPAVFRDIETASELIAWAHRKMGGEAASVGRGGRVSGEGGVSRGAVLREEAAQLRREAAMIDDLGPVAFERFDPADIEVDAGLMQFKAGGDEFGVTDRLQGVSRWNPMLAGRVIVWEAEDGRRLIADGHQRLGLARRIAAQNDGQEVLLDALVLRERDGWDAETVRTWAALKNIAEGSGSTIDAAKVLQGIAREEWAKYLPPRSALVRDAEALVRLGDDAFGMVVNELVDPAHAAVVGRLASDPGEQKALMDLLLRLSPRTIGEAEGVVRQGMAAGFARETQEDMFGALDSTTSLFVERARVLDRGLAELRKMRQVFGSAARNADTLESAGNRIDRERSAQEIEDNARALELVRRSAWSAGPVKDAIDAGARRLADGERIGEVVKEFVAAVRQLDLDDLARLAGSGEGAARGGLADGAGRAGGAAEADAQLFARDGDPADQAELTPEGDRVDPVDGAWPSRDELEAAGQDAFGFGDDPLDGFAEPDAPATQAQAESIAHDVRQQLALDSEDIGTTLAARIDEDFDEYRNLYDQIDDADTGLTTEGGRVLNTDLARELSPEYRADRSRSQEVHEAASAFVKRLYAARLAEEPPPGRDREVLFTAGGTGAGKSTGLKVLGGENAGIIYDTNMNTLASAVTKIEQALDAGWDVDIVYTYREPIEALVNGALPRAERMGRTVPAAVHVETHVGARAVIGQLAERYAGNERVRIRAIDNSRGRGNAREVALADLPEVKEEGLYEQSVREIVAAHERGAITARTLAGSVPGAAGRAGPAARAAVGRADAAGGGQSQPAHGDQALAAALEAERTSLFTIDGEERQLGDMLDQHDTAMKAIEAARRCL